MDTVERAVLGLLDRLATRDDGFVRSEHILDELELAGTPVPRADLYSTLVRMARPNSVIAPLLAGRGNFGSPDDAPADPPYTECRLTTTGQVVWRHGVGEALGLPIDLINGTMWSGGQQPSFDPERVLNTSLRLIDDQDMPDSAVAAAIGAPVFPTGCEVEGEIDALLRGEPVFLLLSAKVTIKQDQRGRVLTLSGFPPKSAPHEVEADLMARFYSRPHPEKPNWVESAFVGVYQLGDPTLPTIEAVLAPSTDEQEILDRITSVDGIADEHRAQVPQPAASALRSWIGALGADRARQNIDQVNAEY